MINFSIKNPTDMTINITPLKSENGIDTYKFSATNPKACSPQMITVSFLTGSEKAFSSWNSNCIYDRSLKADWLMSAINSRLYSGTPTQQIISADGKNVFNVSILDASIPVNIKTGIVEESAEMLCEIEFFAIPISPFEHYETEIRISCFYIRNRCARMGFGWIKA